MDPTSVENAANYELFNSKGQSISIEGVNYDSNLHTATLVYNANQLLFADTYTLLVRGDKITDVDDGLPLAPRGQLVTANSGSDNISLVGVPGDSTLDAAQNYAVNAPSPKMMAVGDVNGDGVPDLVVGGGTEVDVFLGLAAGGFSTISQVLTLPAGADPQQLILAPLRNQGSGFLDIAVADKGTNNVDVFLNTFGVSGTLFTPGTAYGAGASPVGLAVGQFEGNGLLDIAVADGDKDNSGNYDVTILENNAKKPGTFPANKPINVTTPKNTNGAYNLSGSVNASYSGLTGIALYGSEDLALSAADGYGLLINLPNPPSQGDTRPAFDVRPPISSASSSSITSDGSNIAVVASGQVLYVNQPNAKTPNIYIVNPNGGNYSGLTLQDINNDGAPDLLYTDVGASTLDVQIYDSSSPTLFDALTSYNTDSGPVGLAVGNMAAHRDATLDVATVDSGGGDVTVFRGTGPGAGTFITSNDFPSTNQSVPNAVAVGNLTGQGTNDIAVANGDTFGGRNENSISVTVFPNDPLKRQVLNYDVRSQLDVKRSVDYNPSAITIGDFHSIGFNPDGSSPLNADGTAANPGDFNDILVANKDDNTLSLFYNNGDETFRAPIVIHLGRTDRAPTGLAIGDFNGDGILDVAVSHIGNGVNGAGVTILYGTGHRRNPFALGPEYAQGITATKVVAADFNKDGIADLAFVDDKITGSVYLLIGNASASARPNGSARGDGTFSMFGPFAAGENPNNLAVADFNRDGYLDIVVTNTSRATGAGYASVLLNDSGNGFQNPLSTPPITPGNAAFNPTGHALTAVAVTTIDNDFYPDIVVSAAGSANNLYILNGIGDGSFGPAGFYAANGGGRAEPSYVAVTADPLIEATRFTVITAQVNTNGILNGNADSYSLNQEKGYLSGWTTFDQANSNGSWGIQKGDLSPLSGTPLPTPPQGRYSFMLDQPATTGHDGTHIIYQDITIPKTATAVHLTFKLLLDNQDPQGWSDTSLNPSLDFARSEQLSEYNQQFRVDVVDPSADLESVPPAGEDQGNGVLQTLFVTDPSNTFGRGASVFYGSPSQFSLNGDVIANDYFDLTGLVNPTTDRTLRLRFAAVNTGQPLIVGIDDVQLNIVYKDFSAPAAVSVQMRNPGFGATASFGGNTTDTTLIGQVYSSGSPSNVAYVEIDPNNDGFELSSPSSRFYDFGTSTSPIFVDSTTNANVYTPVTPTSIYSATRGFGWTNGTINATDESGTGNALTEDFNSTTDGTFAVDLLDGTYKVTLTIGDSNAAQTAMGIYLEGTKVDTVSAAAGQYLTKTYMVNVTGGQLTVEIVGQAGANSIARINGLSIVSLDTQRYNFGTASSPVANGYTKITDQVTYSASQGYGWSAGTISSTNEGTGDLVRGAFNSTTDGTFSVNLNPTPETYQVTLTIGDISSDQFGMNIYLNGRLVTPQPVSAKAGTYLTETFPVNVSNGRLDIRIQAAAGDPPGSVARINALVISPFAPPQTDDYRLNNFDAQGHFSTTLPFTLPGAYTVGVRVVDKAGNASNSTFTFNLQGPSLTGWQATGPGPTRVTGAFDEDSPVGAVVNYQTVSGRITSVAVDPRDSSGNTYYVGSANGGVWKTYDGGASYTPLTDFVTDPQGNPVPVPIGSVVVAKSDPNVVYAVTGIADHSYDSRPSIGLLVSNDAGATWTVSSAAVFSGALISKMAVDDYDSNIAYVGVAQGGEFGPGLYRTEDGGQTWTNVLDPTKMFLRGGGQLGQPGLAMPSVTDVVIDRLSFNDEDLYVGLGNVGLVTATNAAGVWKSPNHGDTWFQMIGGQDPIPNNTLPFGTAVGKITIGLPTTKSQDEGILYVLISNAVAVGSQLDGGSTTTPNLYGLYKSKDTGLNWTHVMLKESEPIPGDPHNFIDMNLTADRGSYVGALAVDPNDANVVWVGGARDPIQAAPDNSPRHGLIRVDTTFMRDTTTFGLPGEPPIPNDGDDYQKALQAFLNTTVPHTAPGRYTDGISYKHEGVFWYDVSEGNDGGTGRPKGGAFSPPNDILPHIGFTTSDGELLPSTIHTLDFDSSGRLLIGTDRGLWRADNYGFTYQFGVNGVLTGTAGPPGAGLGFTDLNGNLQIADQVSIAVDPKARGAFYTSAAGTGFTQTTNNTQTWSIMALTNNVGPVVVAPTTLPNGKKDRTEQGVPTTVYLSLGLNVVPNIYESVQGGAQGTFVDLTPFLQPEGIRVATDHAALIPALTIDSLKIVKNKKSHNELLYGTQRAYRSDNNGQTWDEVSTTLGSGDVITATAIAPTANLPLGGHAFYVGTLGGRLYADLRNGADAFPELDAGLPVGRPVQSIVVNPNNPQNAYVVYGGANTGGGHVFETTDGGNSWSDITGNLPDNFSYSVAVDPRAFPDQPKGRIYVGTEVGVYTSVNNGAKWTPLGQGLPHVPAYALSLNSNFEELGVATLGRGTFQISTNRTGPQITGVTPSTPVAGLSTIDVSFNEPVDPRTFKSSAVVLKDPNGNAVPLLGTVRDINTSTHDEFEISFFSQAVDGTYTLTILPKLADLSGNLMNQQGSGKNGQQTFTAHFVVNNTDTGRFLSGAFNDLFGQPSQLSNPSYAERFLTQLGPVNQAMLKTLAQTATSFLLTNEARSDLVKSFFTPLMHRTPTDAEVATLVAQLQKGVLPATLIESLASSFNNSEYYVNTGGGVDSGFVAHIYPDLLNGRNPSTQETNAALAALAAAEFNGRYSDAQLLDHSNEYFSNLVYNPKTNTGLIQTFLRRAGSPAEIAKYAKLLHKGSTDEQIIAQLIGGPEYFKSALVQTLDTPNGTNGSNRTWIKAMYLDLVGQHATTKVIQTYLKALNAGTSRTQIAMQVMSTDAYRRRVVTTDLMTILGSASTADVNTYLAALKKKGATDEKIISSIVASAEYVALNTFGPTQADVNSQWVAAAFNTLLGRAPDPITEQPIYVNALASFEIKGRTNLVAGIVTGTEYLHNTINQIYTTDLGRNATTAELKTWTPFLLKKSPGAGKLNPLEQFEATILSSPEYFTDQKDANGIAGEAQWLKSLYLNVYGRAEDPTNDPFNTQLRTILDAYQPQRLAAVRALEATNDYPQGLVINLYQTYLRRDPTDAELSSALTQISKGANDETLIRGLVSSFEYYNNPNIGHGNNSAWLNAAYLDLLGRDTSNDFQAQTYLNALNNGKMTRVQIVTAVQSSDEYRANLIEKVFQTELGHPTGGPGTIPDFHNPDPVLLGWLKQLRNGMTDEEFLARIIALDDYLYQIPQGGNELTLIEHPFP
jgi:FG-GAP-like repeat/Bacterial Ig-like domain